jgi:hypothetical protein
MTILLFPNINKWNEAIGEWKALYNEDIHNLYSSLDIIISSERRRWAGRVTRTKEIKNALNVLMENLVGSDRVGALTCIKIYC